MQGVACAKRRSATPRTALAAVLLLLLLADVLSPANGTYVAESKMDGDEHLPSRCTFPPEWEGRWFQNGEELPVIINSTSIGNRTCIEKDKDVYVVSLNNEECYRCMVITPRHDNVIQYKEATNYCLRGVDVETCQASMTTDSDLLSMFRLDAKPIVCPFLGPPFSFSYIRGDSNACSVPENQAESCTNESKLLLKYQACADVKNTESSTEELQCLATWKDGRNMYLVGTLKLRGRNSQSNEEMFRCFLYERTTHPQGYQIAQSGDASCFGLTSVNEGSRTLTFTKEEKEHTKCKYPSWVTQHHDWHFLDGSKNFHFTTGNSTLKVSSPDGSSPEEKIVCHKLEKMHPNDNQQGSVVKLVAHVTSGCNIGYICMIFHKRDGHIIEVQQSREKAITPHETCTLYDPTTMPYVTLITSTLHKSSCPFPGRYSVLDLVPSRPSKNSRRYRRRAKSLRITDKSSWHDDNNETQECRNMDIQIGCTSTGKNEMLIQETCKLEEPIIPYTCHGSWEEKGVTYTVISRNKSILEKETLCVSLQMTTSTKELPGRMGRVDQQELMISRPMSFCQRETDRPADIFADQWMFRLANQGICEDLTKAASSSTSASSLSRVSFALSIGAAALCSLLSR